MNFTRFSTNVLFLSQDPTQDYHIAFRCCWVLISSFPFRKLLITIADNLFLHFVSAVYSNFYMLLLIEFLFEKRCIQDWFLSEVLQIFYKWTDYFGGRKTKNINTFSVHGSNMGLGIFIFWFSLASNSLTFFLNQHYHWSRLILFSG